MRHNTIYYAVECLAKQNFFNKVTLKTSKSKTGEEHKYYVAELPMIESLKLGEIDYSSSKCHLPHLTVYEKYSRDKTGDKKDCLSAFHITWYGEIIEKSKLTGKIVTVHVYFNRDKKPLYYTLKKANEKLKTITIRKDIMHLFSKIKISSEILRRISKTISDNIEKYNSKIDQGLKQFEALCRKTGGFQKAYSILLEKIISLCEEKEIWLFGESEPIKKHLKKIKQEQANQRANASSKKTITDQRKSETSAKKKEKDTPKFIDWNKSEKNKEILTPISEPNFNDILKDIEQEISNMSSDARKAVLRLQLLEKEFNSLSNKSKEIFVNLFLEINMQHIKIYNIFKETIKNLIESNKAENVDEMEILLPYFIDRIPLNLDELISLLKKGHIDFCEGIIKKFPLLMTFLNHETERLIEFIETDKIKSFEMLLRNGLDPNGILMWNDNTFLGYAVMSKKKNFVRLLLEMKADPNFVIKYKVFLLSPHYPNNISRRPLNNRGLRRAFRSRLRRNDNNSQSFIFQNHLPLHLAIFNVDYSMVKLLLDYGASMTQKNPHTNLNAMQASVGIKAYELSDRNIRLFDPKKRKITNKIKDDRNLPIPSPPPNDFSIIKILVEHGYDINQVMYSCDGDEQRTILAYAVERNDIELVKYFINEVNANPNTSVRILHNFNKGKKFKYDVFPIGFAILNEHLEIANFLLTQTKTPLTPTTIAKTSAVVTFGRLPRQYYDKFRMLIKNFGEKEVSTMRDKTKKSALEKLNGGEYLYALISFHEYVFFLEKGDDIAMANYYIARCYMSLKEHSTAELHLKFVKKVANIVGNEALLNAAVKDLDNIKAITESDLSPRPSPR